VLVSSTRMAYIKRNSWSKLLTFISGHEQIRLVAPLVRLLISYGVHPSHVLGPESAMPISDPFDFSIHNS
jgi:hypothetical protein